MQFFVNQIKHDKLTSFDAMCSLCFSSTVLSRLQPCKHLFCDQCLNKYIEDCILNRTTEVVCPEFKCNFSLNIASVMKYVKSNALFKIYYNKLVQNIILRDENLKQCPTPNCSHIAIKQNLKLRQINRNTSLVVSCVCNKTWCFDCQNEGHWPVSCKLFERYQQQFKKGLGIICDKYGQIYRTNVEYRKCPYCGSPIDKNGRCNHISCVCGEHFCWKCLKPLHDWEEECSEAIGSEKVFTSLGLLDQSASPTVKVFRNAMKFKIMRKELSVLRTKLKLKRPASYFLDPKSLKSVVSESLILIDECYKVFEYSTLRQLNKKLKHGRCKNYISLICLYTPILYDEINFKNLYEINKKRVI